MCLNWPGFINMNFKQSEQGNCNHTYAPPFGGGTTLSTELTCNNVCKRITVRLKSLFSRWSKSMFCITVTATVIATLVSTFVSYLISTKFEEQRQEQKILDSIHNICIGSSKDWIDNYLGPSAFSTQVDDYLQCVYLTDLASVRVFYNVPGNKCCAFFVTRMNQNTKCKLYMPSSYSYATGGKPLGDYSYYEISGSPTCVFGYCSQGVARALYGELYYYMGGGNYYDFYFLSFDYGEYQSVNSLWKSIELVGNKVIDDEVGPQSYSKDLGTQLIADRQTVCPNTFGISDIPSDVMIELIASYREFDSLNFRDENETRNRKK